MRIAVLENDKVVNVVYGEIKKVSKLFESVVQETESTGRAWIGARFNGQKFEPKKPFKGWIWNEDAFEYNPPIERPEGRVFWDEDSETWVDMVQPYPSWTWDQERYAYIAPIPAPDGAGWKWDEKTQSWIDNSNSVEFTEID